MKIFIIQFINLGDVTRPNVGTITYIPLITGHLHESGLWHSICALDFDFLFVCCIKSY